MPDLETDDELTAKENRFLKQTILALRDELDKAEALRAEAVQHASASTRREIGQLKDTARELRDEFERERGRLLGQEKAKYAVWRIVDAAMYRKKNNKDGTIPPMLFHGPPGTGKTTMARLVAVQR